MSFSRRICKRAFKKLKNPQGLSLIVYDFDGVMTDNRVFVLEDGKECVAVHRGDGYGVRKIKEELQIEQIILSTEKNTVVDARAKKLGIRSICGAGDEKAAALKKYAFENKISLSAALYIGNDLNDLDAMRLCGLCACPSDAEEEIRRACDFVFSAKGGRGVVRELYGILSEKKKEKSV